MISLLDLDPAAYRADPIHGEDRTYAETNCYVDCLVEFLHASGREPTAMLGGAVTTDLELDQWTFYKPGPDELFRLYGIDVHEVQPYRGLRDLIATRLAVGQTVIPEVDSFYLPDVAATAYRTSHVKSTIIAEAIDPDARVLRYFHNAGYHELSGDDFDGLLPAPGDAEGDGRLPTYVELLRPDAGPVPDGDELRRLARELLPAHLARRPAENPFARFAARLRADLPGLMAGSRDDYHAYAFHNPRMVGASFELLAGHVRWLFVDDEQGAGAAVAAHLDAIVGGSKVLLFRLARQREFDVAAVLDPMAAAWGAAMAELDALVA